MFSIVRMHGVIAGRIIKGKTMLRDFERDNTKTIFRTKKFKYKNKMLDNKDQNNNNTRNINLKKKDDNGGKKKIKLRNIRKETRVSSPCIAQKKDNSQQISHVKSPSSSRKMVVFYCPHCQEGFHYKEKKEAHARKMTCYFKF